MISIIGVGTGTEMLTIKAAERIKSADVIIGASRIIDDYKDFFESGGPEKKIYKEYHSAKIVELINDCKGKNIAVVVSGDTGFYSLTDSLMKELGSVATGIEIIPGISSVNSFFAKVNRPWQDAALISLHGRRSNLVETVRRNKLTFALTGNNMAEIKEMLIAAGFEDLEVYVGSRLDMEDELIEHKKMSQLTNRSYDKLTVLLIENPKADASYRVGIADDEFIRGDVPMTKSEVRANIISKLEIKPDDVCYDIGAGTGSVTVEMALSAWKGKVIAIEKKPEAVELIKENLKKFHIGNVDVIRGEAADILENKELEAADAAFIGGSDGHLKEIINSLISMNPKVRIVVSAIALETLQTAMDVFKDLGKEVEITQISIAKNRGIAGLNLMMAGNPIFIIKGL